MSSSLDSLKVKPYRKKVYNWSHTFSCYPEAIFKPTSIEEVQLIVNEARKQNKPRRIRPVGEHSSPGQVFCTTDWMMRMHRINHHEIHVQRRQATLGAGMLVRTANKILYEAGLSFPIVGSIDEVSVGAVFSASVHNSSYKHASLTDRVVACTLVLADGSIRKLRRDAEDEEEKALFAATGCGCGATGVIYDVTYELEPAFGLAPNFEKICLREVLAKGAGPGGLLDVAKQEEFVKIWYFPNTTHPDSKAPDAVLWKAERCPPPPLPPDQTLVEGIAKKAMHIFHATAVFICTFIFPALMPMFNKLQWWMQARSLPMQQDPMTSFLAQQMDCLYWQLVEEFAIPFSESDEFGAVKALRDTIDFLDRDKVVGGSLTAPLEIRFSASADTFDLSPLDSKSDVVMWLEPIVYRPMNIPVPERYRRLFDTFDDIARRNGGKPHLAKQRRPPSDDAELERLYPRVGKWRETVKRIDPQGIFWSEFMEEQFGSRHDRRDKSLSELNESIMGRDSLLDGKVQTLPSL